MRAFRTTTGRVLFECDTCASTGAPRSIPGKLRIDENTTALIDSHRQKLVAMRASLEAALIKLAADLKANPSPERRKAAAAKGKDLYANYIAQVLLAERAMPDPGPVSYVATACPWCGAACEADVEDLADGAHEPPHWAAGRAARKAAAQ